MRYPPQQRREDYDTVNMSYHSDDDRIIDDAHNHHHKVNGV